MTSERLSPSELALLKKYSILLCVTNVSYGLFYLLIANSINICLVSSFSGFLCLLTPSVYKFSKSKTISNNYFVISAISIVIFTAFYTGGTKSPVLFWITAIPLGGAFLTRKPWASFRWFLVAIACFFLVFAQEYYFGKLPNELINFSNFVSYFALFGISTINMVFSHLFESALSGENRLIEKQKQELENALDKLKSMQADLIQSEKLASLGTMAAGLAHELNNYLNFISGAVGPIEKYLKKMPEFEEKKKILDLFEPLKRGVNLLVGVVHNFKTYSVQDRGELAKMNISKIVQNVLLITKTRIRSEIVIESSVPENLEVCVSHAGMNQLLTNLLVNAADAIHEKHGKISLIVSDITDGKWNIQVIDTGTGIPKELIGKIFDPFFTTKEVGKGTGLGLHVVMQEVRKHKAEIIVDSQVGKGTRFLITFPIDYR